MKLKKSILKLMEKDIKWWVGFVNKDVDKAINYSFNLLDYLVINGRLTDEQANAYKLYYFNNKSEVGK